MYMLGAWDWREFDKMQENDEIMKYFRILLWKLREERNVTLDKASEEVLKMFFTDLLMQDKDRLNDMDNYIEQLANVFVAMDTERAIFSFGQDRKCGMPATEAINNMVKNVLAHSRVLIEGLQPKDTDGVMQSAENFAQAFVDAWLLADYGYFSSRDNPLTDDLLFFIVNKAFTIQNGKELRDGGIREKIWAGGNTSANRRKFNESMIRYLEDAIYTYEDERKGLISAGLGSRVDAELGLEESVKGIVKNLCRQMGLGYDNKLKEWIWKEIESQIRRELEQIDSTETLMDDTGASLRMPHVRAFNEAYAKAPLLVASFGGEIMTDAGLMRAGSGLDPSRSFTPLADDLSNIDDVAREVSLKLLELCQQVETMGHLEGFKEMQANALGAAQALLAMPDALGPMHRGLLETTAAFSQQDAQMRKFAQNAPMFGEFKKGIEGLATAGKQKLTPELEKMGKELGFTNTTVKGAQVSLQAYEKEMLTTADNADALGVQLLLLSSQAYIDGQITLDEQQAIEAAVAAGMSVDEFAAKCAEYGIDLKDGGGGGRGGSGKSRKERAAEEARKAAEEAQRAQEAAWQKALDDQLKFLDRKKRLGEIDTQEEIRRLELIAAKYAKTTQQKIAMEDKLFEARARLRDEEIGQIDKLNQGIITAIRSRYEEQRKIEEKRLQTSADSWREWADESVKAIQAQIDALDDLAKFEDREEQERKRLHKIEATKQMIEFTHDEANKEQLERELKRLEEDFAKWQRNNAIADAKEQLRAEQDAIRERAAQEQEGIAKQREELHELYDERLKEMSLRAEAERMLVKGNQEEILDLITSYAPEYDAAGKTLGQKLFEGLTGEFGSLTEWFDSLNADIGNIFDHMRERALSAADIHLVGTAQRESQQSNMAPPINVEQHNHFHVPVESPSDTARRIQQVNEELGRQILSRSF